MVGCSLFFYCGTALLIGDKRSVVFELMCVLNTL